MLPTATVGISFVTVTVIVDVTASEKLFAAAPSLTIQLTVLASVVGSLDVDKNVTVLNAV